VIASVDRASDRPSAASSSDLANGGAGNVLDDVDHRNHAAPRPSLVATTQGGAGDDARPVANVTVPARTEGDVAPRSGLSKTTIDEESDRSGDTGTSATETSALTASGSQPAGAMAGDAPSIGRPGGEDGRLPRAAADEAASPFSRGTRSRTVSGAAPPGGSPVAAAVAGRAPALRVDSMATVGPEGSVVPGEIDARVLRLVTPPTETEDGGWQTTVRLDPPDLGTVDATVTVRGGNVAVVLTYQTDATHGALQAALHTIQSNLGDRATVSLADGRLAGGGGGGGGSSGERSAGNSAAGARSSQEPDTHVLLQQYSSVAPRHGQVDVLA